MADEKVIGGGVGSWNTGDAGINDGTAGVGDSADGGRRYYGSAYYRYN